MRRPIIRRVAFDEDALVPIVVTQRAVAGKAGAQHPGHLRQRRFEPLIKPVQLVRCVARKRRIDLYDQAALGDKSPMLVFEIAQASREQARSDQQNDGECDL